VVDFAMSQERADAPEEQDWRPIEDDMLARVKYVARRIVDRVRRVTGEDPPRRAGPNDPTDELPAFG
jgi:hypothetical protein